MNTTKGMDPRQHGATCPDEVEIAGADEAHAPRRMTFAENLILTVKVLVGFGVLGAALWGISLWKAS